LRMKNVLIILMVLAALLFGGFQAWNKWQAQTQAAAAPGRPTTAIAETRNLRFVIYAAGEISPAEQVSVRPEINGRIEELAVDIGDRVRRGDLLLRLDDQDLQTERAARLIEIEGAQLQVEKARLNFQRAERLFADNLVSREVFDNASIEYRLAQNTLVRAEANLDLVQDRLSKTKITAPFDCTVLTRPVSVGQAVSGAGGFNAGTEVMTVANLNEMMIDAHVNQADVTRLTVGQQVDVLIESVPGLRMKGELDRIAPQATIKSNVKGFSARVMITGIDPRVRPGMTANISIPVASAENVVAIPLPAVFTDNGGRFVFARAGGGFERRPVQIGVSDYHHAEVSSGLESGEVVSLVDPQTGARSGSGGEQRPPRGGSRH
jgi:RND family efflux transporter MFP subunit